MAHINDRLPSQLRPAIHQRGIVLRLVSSGLEQCHYYTVCEYNFHDSSSDDEVGQQTQTQQFDQVLIAQPPKEND